MMVSAMLCMKVRANTTPSLPAMLVTETPVAMFCGEIILPITPPDELVAANSTGSRPSCRAATTCRFPNSRDDQGDDQTGQRRLPRRASQQPEEDKHRHDRQDRY